MRDCQHLSGICYAYDDVTHRDEIERIERDLALRQAFDELYAQTEEDEL